MNLVAGEEGGTIDDDLIEGEDDPRGGDHVHLNLSARPGADSDWSRVQRNILLGSESNYKPLLVHGSATDLEQS